MVTIFAATISYCWHRTNTPSSPDDVQTTSGITNTYETGLKAVSILTVTGVQKDGTVKFKVGSDTGSSAEASQQLDYYCKCSLKTV